MRACWLARSDFSTNAFLWFGLVAGLGSLFLKIASEISEGDADRWDSAILFAMRIPGQLSIPRGPTWLVSTMINISAIGSPAVLAIIVISACILLRIRGKRRQPVLLFAATASGAVVVAMLKIVYGRARPEIIPHLVPALNLSFPSGHAADSAIVFSTIAAMLIAVEKDRNTRIFVALLAIALTLAIGLSRIYLGVHWPSDVLAGWAFGAGWALLWRIAWIKPGSL